MGGYVSAFSDFFALASLILLLWVYLITEKFNPTVFDPTNAALEEIENQAKYYIALKTALSFVTGVIVAIILVSLQVKLAVMFGLLSFLLNFIPNVGSMIAMVLPLPIVIVDDNLSTFQKVGAFAGPGAVQGYVGNALEPMLFGKSLNMTSAVHPGRAGHLGLPLGSPRGDPERSAPGHPEDPAAADEPPDREVLRDADPRGPDHRRGGRAVDEFAVKARR